MPWLLNRPEAHSPSGGGHGLIALDLRQTSGGLSHFRWELPLPTVPNGIPNRSCCLAKEAISWGLPVLQEDQTFRNGEGCHSETV